MRRQKADSGVSARNFRFLYNLKIKRDFTCKVKFDWNSMSHWSGARESREIERGNLSIQSLNPVSGHILTS